MSLAPRRFRYRAFDTSGHVIEGGIDALSQKDAADVLWRRGLTPFEMVAMRQDDDLPWWRRDIGGTGKPSRKAVAAFLREFATLADASFPVDASLRLLTQQAGSGKMKAVARDILEAVLNGSSLYDAFHLHHALFGDDCLAIVRAGEQGGQIASALSRIAGLQERRLLIREKIRSALIYPAILLGMSALSIGVIAGVLIPAIAPVFRDNGQSPPMMVAVFVQLGENGPVIVASVLAVAVSFSFAAFVLSRNARFRLVFSQLQLSLPLLGSALRDLNAERLARTLASLLQAGVPLLHGLLTTIDGIPSLAVRHELGRAAEAVRNGATLSSALRRHVSFAAPVLEMIAIGEASATLGPTLQRIADSNAWIMERKIDRAIGFLTPALTVLVASIIGGIVFATMSAVLSINDLALR